MISRKAGGVTLLELMIVLAILSAVLLTAIPGYKEQVRRGYRSIARAELQKAALRQEQFFVEHHAYASSLESLGYPGDRYVLTREGNALALPAEGGIYVVSLEIGEGTWELTASPLQDDPRCGTLSLDVMGFRWASGRAGVTGCW